MKRTTLIILALFCLGALAAPAVAANRQDFKVIQNAVKQSPGPPSRGERSSGSRS